MIAAPQVVYPSSDGEPMADNTIQFDWISLLKWNAEFYYRDRADVFVAGDHLIYPVEDASAIRQAPDVFIAFGRPKGDRGSYQVWKEGGLFPQVVLEVWSPSNRFDKMQAKFDFYERYGAEEYYIVYPEFPAYVEAWVRDGDRLEKVVDVSGHTSPRLGWTFKVHRGRLAVYGPDGKLFRRPDEIAADLNQMIGRADAALAQAEAERARAEAERARADRLAAKLRALGIDPDAE